MAPRQIDEQTLQQREQEILDSALKLISEQGVEGLTMDKLVREVPYSKGTVYGHFAGKEDLLLALCNRGMSFLVDYFRRAFEFNGSTRERMVVLMFAYLIYSQLHPILFSLVITAKSPGNMEKASPKHREIHEERERLLFASVGGIIQEALDNGDCVNPNGLTLEEIAFTGWSSTFGAITLLSRSDDKCVVRGGLCPQESVMTSVHTVMDGMQWLPLCRDFDFSQTVEQLKSGEFAKEVQILMDRFNCENES